MKSWIRRGRVGLFTRTGGEFHELGIDAVQNLHKAHPDEWGWSHGMFNGGSDDLIALRVSQGINYEPVTRELWKELCGRVVVDVGTHSGIFTLDAFRSGSEHVLSVEPHPINYSRLILNVRYNGFSPAGCYYGAAGDKDGEGKLLVKGGLWRCFAGGRMELKSKNGMEIPVRIRRLDSLIPELYWDQVSVVKIDAENWTANVLDGMGGILDHKPNLIVECTTTGLGEKLKPLGYKFWRIWETGKIEEVEDLLPHNPNNNYNGTHEDCRNRFCSVTGLP